MNFRIVLTILLSLISFSCKAESRIKDIVYFEGIRENMLIGYGLIVGLNGTGDNLKNSSFTEKGLTDFLEKLGVNTRGSNLKTKNVAAVTVTANLSAFARTGSKLSVDVNTLGDAKSLKGGTLLATPLVGADGEVYAVAQGAVSIGSKPSDEFGKPDIINPTSGFVTAGGIIEREIDFSLNNLSTLNLALKDPDITTANSIELAINAAMNERVAHALDPGTVELKIPEQYSANVLNFLADVENITVYPNNIAKIVIDEATGTIVIGRDVTISKVAIAQGNLVVKVSDEDQFLFKIGALGVEPKKSDRGSKITTIEETVKLNDLVEGLNALGVKPKDLITILKTIKYAGALHAEVIVK